MRNSCRRGPATGLHRRGQQLQMAWAPNPVEDYPKYLQLRVQGLKALDHGGHALGAALGVGHQDDRKPQGLGQGGGAGDAAVEQAHHPLDERNVGLGRMGLERVQHVLSPAHPEVQVARDRAADHLVQGRIDKVRTTLEGLDRQTLPAEGGEQPQGEGGLAGPAVGSGQHEGLGWLRHGHCGRVLAKGSG